MNEIKKKFLNKTMALGLSVAVLSTPFAVLSDSGIKAFAATAVTSGTMKFIAQDDDSTKYISGKNVTLTKLSNQTEKIVGLNEAWRESSPGKNTDTNGAASFEGLKAGNYAFTLDLGNNTTVTRFVTYKPKATTTDVKVTALPTKDDVNLKKSGAIGGTIINDDSDPIETTVVIVGKDATWKTKTDDKGTFKVFLPSGAYDVVVIGKDKDANTDDKKNVIYKGIKVQAGQTASPFDKMEGDVDWSTKENQFKYTESKTSTTATAKDSFTNVSKEYKGTVDRDAKVYAYVVDEGTKADDKKDDTYTLLAETTAKYNKTTKVAPFSLKLPAAQPGKKVKVIVQDSAFNTFTKDYSFDLIDPKFKADITQNEIGKDVDITYTDDSKTLGSSNLVVKVKVKGEEDSTYKTLEKSTGTTADRIKDYKVASGKIIILSKMFVEKYNAKPQDYVFSITDAGFDSTKATVEQKINVATTKAPSLTVTASKGTKGTKLTVTAGTGNTIKYVKSGTLPTAAKLYQAVPTDAVDYDKNDEITGLNATTNKYLGVYEVNSKGLVVKFKALTLKAAQIVTEASQAPTATEAPALTATAAAGSVDNSTKVTATAGEKNKLVVKVSNATIPTPKVGDVAPTTDVTYPYSSGSDITGVNADENKYVAVYEVDASNKVVKFKLLTLTSSDIKTPEVLSGLTDITSTNDSVVTAVNNTPLSEAITVATGSTVSAVKEALTVDGGKGRIKVYEDDSKSAEATSTDTVTGTMVLYAIAEDGTETSYTITVQ